MLYTIFKQSICTLESQHKKYWNYGMTNQRVFFTYKAYTHNTLGPLPSCNEAIICELNALFFNIF